MRSTDYWRTTPSECCQYLPCRLRAIGLMLGLVVTGTVATLLQLILYPFLLIFDKDWVVCHR